MLVWLIAGLSGLLAATFGVVLLIPTLQFAIGARGSAQGTVIGHDCEQAESTVYYYPRVSFTTADREWIIRAPCGAVRPQLPLGTQVRVYFPPNDPASAELAGPPPRCSLEKSAFETGRTWKAASAEAASAANTTAR